MAETSETSGDAPGTPGDRFELLSRIGRGGMGVVHRAFDRERGVQVALKTLRSIEPGHVLRFKREFRALRDLRHPNLVELGELFERHGQWFFTMELIEGIDFVEYVRGGVHLADSASFTDSIEGSSTILETAATTSSSSDRGGARGWVPDAVRVAYPQCDLERLRRALAGLARGLAVLHDAGKVHRDVKPSNIMVDADGRVVLLDFGVVAELSASRTFERDRLVGTVKYMAPEQAAGRAVGPQADWYAVGVLMFQALTGRLPFEGAQESVLACKKALPAPSPSELAEGIDPVFDHLCSGLLERDPAQRLGADDVFAALGVDRSADAATWTPRATEGRLLVGRARELEALEEALGEGRQRSVCVFVEGESGIGKSALVEHFVELQRADDSGLVVLRGRCHERERVPYNAFDGIVDDLARYLLGRREATLERLVPERVAALLQLFPALRAIDLFTARAAVAPPRARTSSDARGDAFVALRQLMRRLGERRPLLLVIDDIQWADRDSVSLLEELVHRPGSPPLSLIATQRAGEGTRVSDHIEPIAEAFRRLELAGLTAAESVALVHKLITEADDGGVAAAEIATEARGHPMFIHELVHHAEQRRRSAEPLRLDDAIWSRASQLDAEACALLEVVAVAGAPVAKAVAVAVAGAAPSDVAGRIAALQAGGFVRVSRARGGDVIETYHDRVREAVYGALPDARRRDLHRRIAIALEQAGASADTLFAHFDAAGDAERARPYVVAAAEAAYATMAFARAVDLYRRAARDEDDPERRSELLETLGDALTNDGRSHEAATRFLEVAASASDGARRLDLQRRAAEQFLMSGHLQRGLETTRVVLRELGTSVPSSRVRILAGIVWNQLRLRRHPLTWEPRAVSARERVEADVYWSLACGFSMVDMLLGAYFSARGPLLALRQGAPMQIARACSAAAIGAAITGRGDQLERLLDASARAAAEASTPLASFYEGHARTTAHFIQHNDWRACLDSIREIRPLWREAGRGPGWEMDVTTHFECASYQLLGDHQALARQVRTSVRDARRTGNLFLEVSLRVRFAGRHFVHGRWERARADIEDALSAWRPESESFGNQRAWALWSMSRIALCSGELERFVPELDAEWRTMRRSLLARVPLLRIEWIATYGVYLAAKAHLARRRGRRSEGARLCREAERYAAVLSRMPYPAAPPAEWLLRAGIAWARDDDERAIADTRRALEEARAHPTLVFEAPLLLRLGELLGGSEGEELIAEAARVAAAQGITDLRTFAEAAIPTHAVCG